MHRPSILYATSSITATSIEPNLRTIIAIIIINIFYQLELSRLVIAISQYATFISRQGLKIGIKQHYAEVTLTNSPHSKDAADDKHDGSECDQNVFLFPDLEKLKVKHFLE